MATVVSKETETTPPSSVAAEVKGHSSQPPVLAKKSDELEMKTKLNEGDDRDGSYFSVRFLEKIIRTSKRCPYCPARGSGRLPANDRSLELYVIESGLVGKQNIECGECKKLETVYSCDDPSLLPKDKRLAISGDEIRISCKKIHHFEVLHDLMEMLHIAATENTKLRREKHGEVANFILYNARQVCEEWCKPEHADLRLRKYLRLREETLLTSYHPTFASDCNEEYREMYGMMASSFQQNREKILLLLDLIKQSLIDCPTSLSCMLWYCIAMMHCENYHLFKARYDPRTFMRIDSNDYTTLQEHYLSLEVPLGIKKIPVIFILFEVPRFYQYVAFSEERLGKKGLRFELTREEEDILAGLDREARQLGIKRLPKTGVMVSPESHLDFLTKKEEMEREMIYVSCRERERKALKKEKSKDPRGNPKKKRKRMGSAFKSHGVDWSKKVETQTGSTRLKKKLEQSGEGGATKDDQEKPEQSDETTAKDDQQRPEQTETNDGITEKEDANDETVPNDDEARTDKATSEVLETESSASDIKEISSQSLETLAEMDTESRQGTSESESSTVTTESEKMDETTESTEAQSSGNQEDEDHSENRPLSSTRNQRRIAADGGSVCEPDGSDSEGEEGEEGKSKNASESGGSHNSSSVFEDDEVVNDTVNRRSFEVSKSPRNGELERGELQNGKSETLVNGRSGELDNGITDSSSKGKSSGNSKDKQERNEESKTDDKSTSPNSPPACCKDNEDPPPAEIIAPKPDSPPLSSSTTAHSEEQKEEEEEGDNDGEPTITTDVFLDTLDGSSGREKEKGRGSPTSSILSPSSSSSSSDDDDKEVEDENDEDLVSCDSDGREGVENESNDDDDDSSDEYHDPMDFECLQFNTPEARECMEASLFLASKSSLSRRPANDREGESKEAVLCDSTRDGGKATDVSTDRNGDKDSKDDKDVPKSVNEDQQADKASDKDTTADDQKPVEAVTSIKQDPDRIETDKASDSVQVDTCKELPNKQPEISTKEPSTHTPVPGNQTFDQDSSPLEATSSKPDECSSTSSAPPTSPLPADKTEPFVGEPHELTKQTSDIREEDLSKVEALAATTQEEEEGEKNSSSEIKEETKSVASLPEKKKEDEEGEDSTKKLPTDPYKRPHPITLEDWKNMDLPPEYDEFREPTFRRRDGKGSEKKARFRIYMSPEEIPEKLIQALHPDMQKQLHQDKVESLRDRGVPDPERYIREKSKEEEWERNERKRRAAERAAATEIFVEPKDDVKNETEEKKLFSEERERDRERYRMRYEEERRMMELEEEEYEMRRMRERKYKMGDEQNRMMLKGDERKALMVSDEPKRQKISMDTAAALASVLQEPPGYEQTPRVVSTHDFRSKLVDHLKKNEASIANKKLQPYTTLIPDDSKSTKPRLLHIPGYPPLTVPPPPPEVAKGGRNSARRAKREAKKAEKKRYENKSVLVAQVDTELLREQGFKVNEDCTKTTVIANKDGTIEHVMEGFSTPDEVKHFLSKKYNIVSQKQGTGYITAPEKPVTGELHDI